MNFLDLLFLVPLLWGAVKGLKKGLVIEVASLLALVLGVWGGIHFSDYASNVLNNNFSISEKYMPLVAFALTFFAIVVGVFMVGKLVQRLADMVALSLINKALGGVFGTLKIALIISVLLAIVDSFDEKTGLVPDDLAEGSLLYEPISEFSLVVIPALKNSKLFLKLKEETEAASSELQ